MKQHFLLLSILALTFVSCKKSDTIIPIAPALAGSWKMVVVKDISTGSTIIKPSTISREVYITFTFTTFTSGTINGTTPTNSLTADYTIGQNKKFSIPSVSVTKVMETSWGMEFLGNIRFSQYYIFDISGRLNINTPNKILIFQKM